MRPLDRHRPRLGIGRVPPRVLAAVLAASLVLGGSMAACGSKPKVKPAPALEQPALPDVDPCRQAQHLKLGITAAAARRILVASPYARTITCPPEFGEEAPDCLLLDYRSEACNLVVYLSARDHRVLGWGPLSN